MRTPATKKESSLPPSGSGARREEKALLDELQNEITIAGSVDAVGGRSIEAEFFRHGAAIERQVSPRPRRPNPRAKHSAACDSQPGGRRHAETFQRRPGASARPARARHVAGACRRAWPRFPPVRRDRAQRSATPPDRPGSGQSKPERKDAGRSAICSLRLRPLCSLYPVSPISATSCFSTK